MECENCGSTMHWEGSMRDGGLVCPYCDDSELKGLDMMVGIDEVSEFNTSQIEAYKRIVKGFNGSLQANPVPAPDEVDIWCGNCGYTGTIDKRFVSNLAHGPCPICGKTGYLQPTYQAPKILRCGHCGMRTPADRVYGNPSNATCPHCFATGRMIEVT